VNKVKGFCEELRALYAKYDMYLGVNLEGDTHGLSTKFMLIDKDHNDVEVLNHYNSYLDIEDIVEFLEGMK